MISEDVIPNNWEVKKLSQIGEIETGGTPSTKNDEFWGGDITWLRITDIEDKLFVGDSEDKITEKGLNSASCSILPEGSVIISTRATIGKVAIAEEELATNQGFKSVIPNGEITSKFLAFYIESISDSLASSGRGATYDEVSKGQIKKIKVPVPPKEEQKEIVSLLEDKMDNLEKLKRSTNSIGQLSKEYEDSLLAFILSGKKDMSEGAVGGIPTEDVVPNKWRLENFGDVVDVNPRISKPDTDTFAHVPMDGVSAETQSIDYFSERDSVYSGLAKFEKGDILFARITPCMENGKVAIVDELPGGRDMSFGSTELAVFRTQEDVSTEYVFNYVKSQFIREVAKDRMKGATGRERVPLDFFKKELKIPIPPKGQEEQVLGRLRNIRENVNRANHSIKMVDELFDEYRDSILAHAFKGELTLEENDQEVSNRKEQQTLKMS